MGMISDRMRALLGEDEVMRCGRCGTKVSASAKGKMYCPRCGVQFAPSSDIADWRKLKPDQDRAAKPGDILTWPDGWRYQKGNDRQWRRVHEAKALPTGTRRHRSDGKTYVKQADGGWKGSQLPSEHGLHAVGEHGSGLKSTGGGFFAVFRPKGSEQRMPLPGSPFKSEKAARAAAEDHLAQMRKYGSPAAPPRKG